MTESPNHDEPDDLAVPEKFLRVQDLWDESARTPREVEVTPAQREELERRLMKHQTNPGKYATWEEIRHELEGSE
ncbi:MAG TPA: addiction module protein [Planctomycetota bacterium]|nr:addiction module protein [Planctomycetota bacterium]